MALRFHRRVFEKLGEEPAPSEENAQIVAQREKELGVKFPASVREWFSLEGVFELFRANTNEDELVTNEHLADGQRLAMLGDPDETARGYLRVAVENQGVIGWYVPLDGSDDPPVLHNDDDWDSPVDEVVWVRCSDRFSEFLFSMMCKGD